MQEEIVRKHLSEIESKFIVQQNGINRFWLESIRKDSFTNNHSIIYVGSFIPRKNVDKLIIAVANIRKKESYKDLKLVIVGGGKDRDLFDRP